MPGRPRSTGGWSPRAAPRRGGDIIRKVETPTGTLIEVCKADGRWAVFHEKFLQMEQRQGGEDWALAILANAGQPGTIAP